MESLFSEKLGGILYGISYADLAIPIGLTMWAVILLISLKGVDPNHFIAALLYAGYCCFAGVMLINVLPEKYIAHQSTTDVFGWFLLFLTVALLRWGLRLLKHKKLLQQRVMYGKEQSK
ncbi:MAG: hypothetical protein HYW48_04180 [Deltaproteobacteria bacterium]|nr:hypothetical protein [Deltaproteobacteria bacterium]